MDKNAEFIRGKEFHVVFKGYKPEEVDKFLDILSVEFDRLLKKNRELQESLDKLKFENTVEQDNDIKKIIQDALISAHRVAEDIKSQATKEAEEIIEQKKNDEEKAMSGLKMKKLEIEESIILMQSKYDEFKGKLQKTVDDLNQFISESDLQYTVQPDFTEKTEQEQDIVHEEVLYRNEEVKTDTIPDQTIMQETKDDSQPDKNEDNTLKDKTIKDFNDLADFKIRQGTDSGYYFNKVNIEESKENTQPQENIKDNTANEIKSENQQDPGMKRERKKIDIANPDIIENFFKTSDD